MNDWFPVECKTVYSVAMLFSISFLLMCLSFIVLSDVFQRYLFNLFHALINFK